MSILDKLYNQTPQVGDFNTSLFKEDNENGGLFTKTGLITEMLASKQQRPSFITHTKSLFEHMQLKRRFSQVPSVGYENGLAGIWCRFKYGNFNINLFVPKISGMEELVNEYGHDRIVINTSFDDLMRQAAGEL